MSIAELKTAAPAKARAIKAEKAIAPVLIGGALSAIGGFGVALAAGAPDDYGYVAGFGFLLFAYVMVMHYFGKLV